MSTTTTDVETQNRASRTARRERMESADWTPTYSAWRHGGSYVDNIVYPSGAVGCIVSARHTTSKRFESACFDLGTFTTRDAAAHAERAHAIAMWEAQDVAEATCNFVLGENVTIGKASTVWEVKQILSDGMVMLGKNNPKGWYDNRMIEAARLVHLADVNYPAIPTPASHAIIADWEAELLTNDVPFVPGENPVVEMFFPGDTLNPDIYVTGRWLTGDDLATAIDRCDECSDTTGPTHLATRVFDVPDAGWFGYCDEHGNTIGGA